jgi:Family of unknown function (DUF5946)
MQHNIRNEKYDALAFYTLGLQDECFIHQFIVDAYTAQAADSSTKAISLAFSLVGLYLVVEKNFTGKKVQAFHALMGNNKTTWPDFELPENRGEINIDMVLKAELGEERNKMIKIWCNSVWGAYCKSHLEVKELAAYYLNITIKK